MIVSQWRVGTGGCDDECFVARSDSFRLPGTRGISDCFGDRRTFRVSTSNIADHAERALKRLDDLRIGFLLVRQKQDTCTSNYTGIVVAVLDDPFKGGYFVPRERDVYLQTSFSVFHGERLFDIPHYGMI